MWPLIIANIAVGVLLGGMVFFAAVTTPTAFKALPTEMSRAYIRAIFPRYYLSMGLAAFISAVALAIDHPSLALLMALVTLGFVISRQVLMPLIHKWRDAGLAGNEKAMKSFREMHRMSLGLNLVQLLAALLVMLQIAAAGGLAIADVRASQASGAAAGEGTSGQAPPREAAQPPNAAAPTASGEAPR